MLTPLLAPPLTAYVTSAQEQEWNFLWGRGAFRAQGGRLDTTGGGEDQSRATGNASLPPLLTKKKKKREKKMASGVPAREVEAKHNDTAFHMLWFSVSLVILCCLIVCFS